MYQLSKPRKCKNWLATYAEYTKSSEAPKAFHIWTGISTIAAVLQRKVWIEQRIFQWTPNFYIVFVGPAGVVTKSTTVKIGANLLREVDGVVFGPNSLTWNALTVSLEAAQKAMPMEPGNPGSELAHMACVTCSVGELGTFLDPSDRKMVDVFTDLWDGQKGVWEHSTKTQGSTTITNPWLNIIAATTPSWLKENFPESMIGGGLTSRIVFVYGANKRQFIPYPALLQEASEHAKLEADLIHDLKIMNELQGEYKMTDDAHAWGAAWYEEHWKAPKGVLANARFEGYRARKQTHLHKLAIVIAASKSNNMVITSGDLKTANHMVTLLEKDMLKVFESIGATDESRHTLDLINILYTFGKQMKQDDLFVRVSNHMTVEDFAKAVAAGIKANYFKVANHAGNVIIHLAKTPDNYTANDKVKQEEE